MLIVYSIMFVIIYRIIWVEVSLLEGVIFVYIVFFDFISIKCFEN